LHFIHSFALLLSSANRGLAIGRMPFEGSGMGKLTELVTNHVFGYVNWYVLTPVMNCDRQSDKIGKYRGASRPGLDRALIIGRARGFYLLDQMQIHERAFLD